MYDFFNILAGIFLIGTLVSIVYVIIKAAKKQFNKQFLLIPLTLFLIYLVICAFVPDKPASDSEPEQTAAVTEADTTAAETTEASTTEPASTEPETTAAETTAAKEISDASFIADVTSAIDGQIGQGEAYGDVTLKDGDLCVSVDFSNADPAPLTLEDLALSRVSSITDAILELDQYDSLWNTITVDFGDVGKVTNKKADIAENGYGRYFPAENFTLTK